MKKKVLIIIIDNIKTLLGALLIAILIRSLLLQPFYIPSSSMEPSLLVGDRLFVSKLSYGYSKHSFPFSLGPIKNRILFVGLGKTFQIWEPNNFYKFNSFARKKAYQNRSYLKWENKQKGDMK